MTLGFGRQSHSEAAFKVGNTGFKTLRLLPGDHRFLSAAMDGTVGIYNMRLKRWDHEVMSGHCETIFACEFQATDRCGNSNIHTYIHTYINTCIHHSFEKTKVMHTVMHESGHL